MKSLKVSDLKEGMAFTHPVYVDGENLLVPEVVRIRAKDIARLKRWGLQTVQTEGTLIEKKENENSSPSMTSQYIVEGKRVHDLYNASLENLQRLFRSLFEGKSSDHGNFTDILKGVVPEVENSGENWLNYALSADREKNPLVQSSLNTTIFTLVMGSRMNFSKEALEQLGYAALLHDVGMLWIPDEIRTKKEKLNSKEFETIKAHPLYSYKIITGNLRLSPEIAEIAVKHHERWDGKGYPTRLAGEKIPLATRVLSLADAFEAMMWDKPYRESLLGYKAMRQIINDNSRRFDVNVVRNLVHCVGIYPVGSFVNLNDGAVGLVVKSYAEAPLRPVVRILVSGKGEQLEKDQQILLDLLKNHNAFIVRSFNPKAEEKSTM